MERRHIKWVPLLLAGLFFAYQYFSSEKFVNPETGRASHVGMSTREEALLGLQGYEQVLGQSESIDSGPELEMVRRVSSRLANATGKVGADFDWQVSLIRSPQVNAFCLPGGKIVVYTGILPITQNEPALATVLGHEMAHATSHMGRAGYDPRESIRFWQRMENVGGPQPPEFLSSHPSHGTRIQQLEAEMPKALEEYNRSNHAAAPGSF